MRQPARPLKSATGILRIRRAARVTAIGAILALAACSGGGPSPAAMKAWQSGAGGKNILKLAQYLTAANAAIAGGNTQDALGGGVLVYGFALQSADSPPPADASAYKQEMTDLEAYGKALMGLSASSSIGILTGPLNKAQAVINQNKSYWWAQKLDDAMNV